MKILAIDFSSAQRSAAVFDGEVIAESVETGGRHANALAIVETALREAKLEREQIECLAIGIGPGSYTGIRAAIALAQGWQLAAGVKILGVSSADGIAEQARWEGFSGTLTVVIDAQRNEFYLLRCELTAAAGKIIQPLRLASFDEVKNLDVSGEILVGPGITARFAGGKNVFPRAAALATLAARRQDYVCGEKLEPIYLRETTFVKAPPSRVIS